MVALTDGAVAGFVAKVPNRIHIPRHRQQGFRVLVFDAEFEGFGMLYVI